MTQLEGRTTQSFNAQLLSMGLSPLLSTSSLFPINVTPGQLHPTTEFST